jgi:orotate phosphoribosyltransferase
VSGAAWDRAAARARLIALLRQRSVRRQRVVLASGRESDFYVDARLTTLDPEGAHLVAGLVLDRLAADVEAVGGPVTGADPIVGAVVAASWTRGRPVHGFMVRKEAKGHGLGQWLEGRANLREGARVCMIEDTVTSGGSVVRAVERVRAAGLEVVQCICVVDREEGAADALAAVGLEALTKRGDLLDEGAG